MIRQNSIPLSQLPIRQKAVITAVDETGHPANPHLPSVLEKRLLEMGFVEGSSVMILHEAPFSHDPIIVRLRNNRIALRRSEAACILVTPETATT